MQILLIKKRTIFLNILSIFLIVAIILFSLSTTNSFAIELIQNSVMSPDLFDKISSTPKSNEKIAYLTFDDGPTINATPKILDILKEENVKATFFVIGKYVEKHPEIVKRAFDEGHYIGNHGYDHNNSVLYKSNESFINEIKKTDIAIGNALGIDNYCSHIFRFPNGFMSPNNKGKKKNALNLLKDLNYSYVDY